MVKSVHGIETIRKLNENAVDAQGKTGTKIVETLSFHSGCSLEKLREVGVIFGGR